MRILRILKARRVRMGFLQKDLAKKCGVSKQVICEIETGKQRPWRYTLVRICDELSMPDIDRASLFRHFKHEDVSGLNDPIIIVRSIRKKIGMTQDDLAARVGSNRGVISKFEKGELINLELAELICDALGIKGKKKSKILKSLHEDNEHQEPETGVHAGMPCEPAHDTN